MFLQVASCTRTNKCTSCMVVNGFGCKTNAADCISAWLNWWAMQPMKTWQAADRVPYSIDCSIHFWCCYRASRSPMQCTINVLRKSWSVPGRKVLLHPQCDRYPPPKCLYLCPAIKRLLSAQVWVVRAQDEKTQALGEAPNRLCIFFFN